MRSSFARRATDVDVETERDHTPREETMFANFPRQVHLRTMPLSTKTNWSLPHSGRLRCAWSGVCTETPCSVKTLLTSYCGASPLCPTQERTRKMSSGVKNLSHMRSAVGHSGLEVEMSAVGHNCQNFASVADLTAQRPWSHPLHWLFEHLCTGW